MNKKFATETSVQRTEDKIYSFSKSLKLNTIKGTIHNQSTREA